MADGALPQIGGYVLAGGRSSRMGTDKALLEIGGWPLVAHAVEKLRIICAEVHILTSNEALGNFAPLLQDLHPGCGPIGGIEAALAHSGFDWNLIVPVDLPFVPSAFLRAWVGRVLEREGARLAYFDVAGRAQPTLVLIHREAGRHISAAIERGEYKVLQTLQAAADGGSLYVEFVCEAEAQLWFANLNTPEEFELARRRAGELEC
jgi:molybdopterin-guanine dinucleotide biosynthesis protein A